MLKLISLAGIVIAMTFAANVDAATPVHQSTQIQVTYDADNNDISCSVTSKACITFDGLVSGKISNPLPTSTMSLFLSSEVGTPNNMGGGLFINKLYTSNLSTTKTRTKTNSVNMDDNMYCPPGQNGMCYVDVCPGQPTDQYSSSTDLGPFPIVSDKVTASQLSFSVVVEDDVENKVTTAPSPVGGGCIRISHDEYVSEPGISNPLVTVPPTPQSLGICVGDYLRYRITLDTTTFEPEMSYIRWFVDPDFDGIYTLQSTSALAEHVIANTNQAPTPAYIQTVYNNGSVAPIEPAGFLTPNAASCSQNEP